MEVPGLRLPSHTHSKDSQDYILTAKASKHTYPWTTGHCPYGKLIFNFKKENALSHREVNGRPGLRLPTQWIHKTTFYAEKASRHLSMDHSHFPYGKLKSPWTSQVSTYPATSTQRHHKTTFYHFANGKCCLDPSMNRYS